MTRFEKGLDLLPSYLFEPSFFGNVTTEMERMLEEFGIGRYAFRARLAEARDRGRVDAANRDRPGAQRADGPR